MNEVQTIQGLPSLDSEGSIMAALKRANVIRLPQIVHQAMADSINYKRTTLQENQAKLRKLLLDYITDHFPGYGLGGFIELLTHEARKISLYLPFGIYIQLIPGETTFTDHPSLEDTFKQLTR